MRCIQTTAAAALLAAACTAAWAAPVPADAPPPSAEAGGGSGFGSGPGPRPGHRMGGPGFPFLGGIALSEAQEDRLFAIMHAQAPQLREQEKAERKAAQALRAMKESGQYDEAQASAQARALGQAIAAQEVLRARTASQVMALLTPQQKEALQHERDDEGGPRGPRR